MLQNAIAIVAACVLGSPIIGLGQQLSIGVVGGGSLTSAAPDQFFPIELVPPVPGAPVGIRWFSPSKDYVVGGMLELRFDPNWSAEADGLFRELHLTSAAVLPDGSLNSVSPSPVITWEFPVLAKYRLQGWRANPFIEAGPSFRTTGNLNGSNPSNTGITAGLGIEMNWRGMKIAPMARYTRWAEDQTREGPLPNTAPNQVELLVGLSRGAESSWRPLGQRVSLGVILGTNLTGDYRTVAEAGDPVPPVSSPFVISSGPRKLAIGPAVELKLPWHVGVEANALYRPISVQSQFVNASGTSARQTYSFVTWEFPVLAKYSVHVGVSDVFVGAGPSFRLPQGLPWVSPYGIATGTGVTFPFHRVKITPSFRYTHWAPDRAFSTGGPIGNQTAVFVGFSL